MENALSTLARHDWQDGKIQKARNGIDSTEYFIHAPIKKSRAVEMSCFEIGSLVYISNA